jgi:hypothetical protein
LRLKGCGKMGTQDTPDDVAAGVHAAAGAAATVGFAAAISNP